MDQMLQILNEITLRVEEAMLAGILPDDVKVIITSKDDGGTRFESLNTGEVLARLSDRKM